MSAGSLKELLRTLNNALSAPVPLYPLPDDVLSVIHAYLNKHINTEDHDSQRLHEELLVLHEQKVRNNPDKHATFLTCFRSLRPAIIGVERLLKWWEILVRPTLDSMGQAKAVVADARAIVLSVLAYDDDDDPTAEKAAASAVFTDKLFEVFLEKTKLLSLDRSAGYREEQRQRFVCANVETVLLAFGKRRPKVLLEKIDSYVVQKEYRLQALGLLCSFVRLQGPHLYQILQTSLLDHLLQCLENDTSTTVISLALTVLIMFMPHLCNSLASYLPRLFVVYTRVLCWDKFGVVRLEETRLSGHKDNYSRTSTPLSFARTESSTTEGGWQKLDSSFETASSTTPDVSDYFTFLYGLYPINFLLFIREPYKFLERADYKDIDQLDIEEETIRQRTEFYRQRHTLHPNFLVLTAETEISDQSRWMKVEPADVTAECIGLVHSNLPVATGRERKKRPSPLVPEALVPTEDIPDESLLSSEPVDDDYSLNHDDSSTYSSRAGESTTQLNPNSSYPEVLGLFSRPPVGYARKDSPEPHIRDNKIPDSPTIPHSLSPTDEDRVQDMIRLQETLRANFMDSKNISTHSLGQPNGPPPTGHPPGPPPGYGSVTASPRLEAYVHSLSHNIVPRSPALRPTGSDTQGNVAFLQREVMLLKNDLNFERYLKQQHLSHIGHLQRKHIKEATAEAETQNLINTNKTLKAKLEEAKKTYAASRQEALKSKNQAKKWEAELNIKIRALREEQKVWRSEEESTKKALTAAREEADHLRKLLGESETEGLRCRQKLQALTAEMDEVNKLRTFVDHLSNKLTEYETRSEEFEMQKHNEEAAIAQVDRMKLRLQAREHESQNTKRQYDAKIHELELKLSQQSSPTSPQSPTPAFQGMIDNALSVANSRLASLKKAHSSLLGRYTELEIKFIELQAAQEIDSLPIDHSSQNNHRNPSHGESDGESSHYRTQRAHYHSEGSLSPHSASYSGSTNSNYSAAGQNIHFPSQSQGAPSSTTNPLSPGYISSGPHTSTGNGKFPEGFMSSPTESSQQNYPQDHTNISSLRHRPSVIDSMASSSDSQSMRTVTSTTSSEKRKEKIKPQSEIRIRGRGGVQNIGKKDKEKSEKDKEKKEKKEKREKKFNFTTGSGLAGIRGFG